MERLRDPKWTAIVMGSIVVLLTITKLWLAPDGEAAQPSIAKTASAVPEPELGKYELSTSSWESRRVQEVPAAPSMAAIVEPATSERRWSGICVAIQKN